jgi:hypothetical protein
LQALPAYVLVDVGADTAGASIWLGLIELSQLIPRNEHTG